MLSSDGRNRRFADKADRRFGRLNWLRKRTYSETAVSADCVEEPGLEAVALGSSGTVSEADPGRSASRGEDRRLEGD